MKKLTWQDVQHHYSDHQDPKKLRKVSEMKQKEVNELQNILINCSVIRNSDYPEHDTFISARETHYLCGIGIDVFGINED